MVLYKFCFLCACAALLLFARCVHVLCADAHVRTSGVICFVLFFSLYIFKPPAYKRAGRNLTNKTF